MNDNLPSLPYPLLKNYINSSKETAKFLVCYALLSDFRSGFLQLLHCNC